MYIGINGSALNVISAISTFSIFVFKSSSLTESISMLEVNELTFSKKISCSSLVELIFVSIDVLIILIVSIAILLINSTFSISGFASTVSDIKEEMFSASNIPPLKSDVLFSDAAIISTLLLPNISVNALIL